ncbi:hypothetical protein CPB86DRAFT_820365 [Serendipita vermifera]|nr:hypothetical protein CPB86DRAFT_820365 [Serendipita vermifera]
MEDPNYPLALGNFFQTACVNAQLKLTPFFEYFYTNFGKVPDERGLTDQLLVEFKQTMGSSLKIYVSSQRAEGAHGSDYTLYFTTEQGQKRAVYLQAKSIKEDDSIDFTYENQLAPQYDLLAMSAMNHNEGGSKAIGGYIIYSGAVLMFIPVKDVIAGVEALHMQKVIASATINKRLCKHFASLKEKYPLINMYTMPL